ncbi:hypothetical protein ACOMHN_043992 [Nucella lapillus]
MWKKRMKQSVGETERVVCLKTWRATPRTLPLPDITRKMRKGRRIGKKRMKRSVGGFEGTRTELRDDERNGRHRWLHPGNNNGATLLVGTWTVADASSWPANPATTEQPDKKNWNRQQQCLAVSSCV